MTVAAEDGWRFSAAPPGATLSRNSTGNHVVYPSPVMLASQQQVDNYQQPEQHAACPHRSSISSQNNRSLVKPLQSMLAAFRDQPRRRSEHTRLTHEGAAIWQESCYVLPCVATLAPVSRPPQARTAGLEPKQGDRCRSSRAILRGPAPGILPLRRAGPRKGHRQVGLGRTATSASP